MKAIYLLLTGIIQAIVAIFNRDMEFKIREILIIVLWVYKNYKGTYDIYNL